MRANIHYANKIRKEDELDTRVNTQAQKSYFKKCKELGLLTKKCRDFPMPYTTLRTDKCN